MYDAIKNYAPLTQKTSLNIFFQKPPPLLKSAPKLIVVASALYWLTMRGRPALESIVRDDMR